MIMDHSIKPIDHYLPEPAVEPVFALLKEEHVEIKVKRERKTRHGDYRRLPKGHHQITVNSSLNPYKFLITLIHEIAHLKAYQSFGRSIKPHGQEWKFTFQHLMLPFLNPHVFPPELLPTLAQHFKNPRASSDTDYALALALKKYNPSSDLIMVSEIGIGQTFSLYNGKIFKRGEKRRKRIECMEVKTGRIYLFNPLAEVNLLQ
jgi:SprT protein